MVFACDIFTECTSPLTRGIENNISSNKIFEMDFWKKVKLTHMQSIFVTALHLKHQDELPWLTTNLISAYPFRIKPD